MKKRLQHITCYSIAVLLGTSLLLTGCVKKEITRQADWETHFTDIHFCGYQTRLDCRAPRMDSPYG